MKRGNLRFVNVGTTSGPICGAAPNRTAIVFSSPLTNRVTISVDAPAVDRQGLVLYPAGGWEQMCKCDFGDVVTRPILGIANAAAEVIGVTEVFSDAPDEE